MTLSLSLTHAIQSGNIEPANQRTGFDWYRITGKLINILEISEGGDNPQNSLAFLVLYKYMKEDQSRSCFVLFQMKTWLN